MDHGLHLNGAKELPGQRSGGGGKSITTALQDLDLHHPAPAGVERGSIGRFHLASDKVTAVEIGLAIGGRERAGSAGLSHDSAQARRGAKGKNITPHRNVPPTRECVEVVGVRSALVSRSIRIPKPRGTPPSDRRSVTSEAVKCTIFHRYTDGEINNCNVMLKKYLQEMLVVAEDESTSRNTGTASQSHCSAGRLPKARRSSRTIWGEVYWSGKWRVVLLESVTVQTAWFRVSEGSSALRSSTRATIVPPRPYWKGWT